MAQSRKPDALKLIAGTTRPDRAVEGVALPLLTGHTDAPDWLPNAHAVKEWNRLAPILTKARLLTDGGLSALGILCALHGKLVQLWTAGEAPTGALLAAYRGLTNDFGLTPVAQGKVRPSGDAGTANPFTTNGKRAP